MKIKRIIFWIQEFFRRKPKTKKAEPMFHAPLNEPWATMQKQYFASQCQSTADQREWMICRNAQTLTPPQPHKLPGLSVDVRTTVLNERMWHVPKPTITIIENRRSLQIPSIPFAIESIIIDALAEAKEKHPHFADTDAEAGTVIAEELLEVNTAALKVMQGINDQADRDNLFVELAQAIATEIRMMEMLLK